MAKQSGKKEQPGIKATVKHRPTPGALKKVTKSSPRSAPRGQDIAAVPHEGIFDIFKEMKLVKKFIDAIQNGASLDTLQTLAAELSKMFGYEVTVREINEFIDDVQAENVGMALKDFADLLNMLGDRLLANSQADDPVRLASRELGRRRLDAVMEKARANPQAWYAENKEAIQKGLRRPGMRFLLRNHPEVAASLTTDELKAGASLFDFLENGGDPAAINWDKVIAFLEKIMPILEIASAFIPYMIPVVAVLKIVIEIYHRNHDPVELSAIFSLAA